jgi:thioredoxin-like negative regulator of GroEL
MLDRLLLTGLLIVGGILLFWVLRGWHMRRAGAAHRAVAVHGRPALLYFRSDSCAPCVAQWHYVQQVLTQFDGKVAVEKIDADVEHEQAARYGIFTLPTTLIIDGAGIVRHINYGLTDARKLCEQLETVVSLAA